jgi:hypothetical protein
MIDNQTITILQKQIRRTGRSFLSYVHESFPWTRGNSDRALLETIQHMVRHEREAVTAIARFLQTQRSGPPYLGAYPMNFTSYNFLQADRLIPLLIGHEEADINDLENDLDLVNDDEARGRLDRLLRAKKEHLAALKELQAKPVAAD